MSLFITLEGIEGSGKSTQIKLLKKALSKKGHRLVLTREPGGTLIGDQIRHILLTPKNKIMIPLCELLLYEACRAQHVQEKIHPALKAGKVVISDRYFDASTVYQGAARKLPKNLVKNLNQIAIQGIKPHLTFILDCPVSMGLGRMKKRYRSAKQIDRIELEKKSFHEKIRKGYLQLSKKEPKRVKVIDATQSPKDIHKDILKWVSKKI
jgi:dTMP kinase